MLRSEILQINREGNYKTDTCACGRDYTFLFFNPGACNRCMVSARSPKRKGRILGETRFRCQECGRLIPRRSHKCTRCGSYDVDIDV